MPKATPKHELTMMSASTAGGGGGGGAAAAAAAAAASAGAFFRRLFPLNALPQGLPPHQVPFSSFQLMQTK